MVTVRMTASVSLPGLDLQVGQIVDLPEDLAERLSTAGQCYAAGLKGPPVRELAERTDLSTDLLGALGVNNPFDQARQYGFKTSPLKLFADAKVAPPGGF